ncbi:MAG: ABC transporter ATP-binding protein [gamma proteobacterium endosymbiont of Lamellibrachia anaximandri]|nr:ABC transporter ATP-binding protein [gamma proteobacterium endosymbiont of Lamellibrachia anaximandri]MBL3617733.1 ABC transporter ATP-binding protein [gamma proteobacterium endosymbiont of Lamellibrachia anaximandri]
MKNHLLAIENLHTRLGNKQNPVRVVDGLNLTIRQGETLALLGESGCGKSMTALTMMRLLPPSGRISDGHVKLDGLDLLTLSEQEMRQVRGGHMGMIFQEPMTSLNPVLRIGDQIAEAVRLHDKLSGAAVTERVVELLDSVGIPDPRRRVREYPHQLSGGMKQRVMIAMALAGRPELLIADEPTTALDVTIQAQVLTLLKQLQQETGMAILLITHDLGVVAETADRLAVMYAGQIVETADVGAFFEGPKHPYSRKLFESLPDSHKRDEKLAVIKGTVPPLNQRFSGCRFADRCEQAISRCGNEIPDWVDLTERQGVRCLIYADDPITPTLSDTSVEAETHILSQGGDESLLDVTDLKVHFPIHKGVFRRVVGQVRAVDGVGLSIAKGRTLALVGESGCGKTTVGKGILQLIRPTEGQVKFGEDELTQLKGEALRQRRADMQIIFQDPMSSMNPRMLVGEIIAEGMRAQKIGNKKDRKVRVSQLLEQVGLHADAAKRYPHEFSGGQRQRICVARALAVEPQLIVCDEPTSALDVSVQAQILNLLKSLQRELELSYLFITHNISVVSYLADEVAVMYLGRIVEQGSVEKVLGSPAHPYTKALLSAVPVPDPDYQRSVIRLEGDMPSPANPPQGCHFHPRCPEAVAACSAGYPAETALSETHRVRCSRIGEL